MAKNLIGSDYDQGPTIARFAAQAAIADVGAEGASLPRSQGFVFIGNSVARMPAAQRSTIDVPEVCSTTDARPAAGSASASCALAGHAAILIPDEVGVAAADRMRPRGRPPTTFHDPRNEPMFAELYLETILRPGIEDPIDGSGLLNASYDELSNSGALIAIAWNGPKPCAGLYTVIGRERTAWLNGVRVIVPFRGRGFGSYLVRGACKFLATQLGIRRFALTVRCDGTGKPYEPAFATYVRCGFVPAGRPHAVSVAGSPRDAHLGVAGSSFLALNLEASL